MASYDCWTHVMTRHGLPADEVISALQKMIRRGNIEEAVRFAYEMYLTSEAMENYLWLRLAVISVEDIGLADPNMPVLINALDSQRQKLPYGSGDRMLFAIHGIRLLCLSEKTRSNDHLLNLIMREVEHGCSLTIPDIALDMHTQRGQRMGRGMQHFLREASLVEPVWHGDEPDYLQKLLTYIDNKE